jgi:hypothetical protein
VRRLLGPFLPFLPRPSPMLAPYAVTARRFRACAHPVRYFQTTLLLILSEDIHVCSIRPFKRRRERAEPPCRTYTREKTGVGCDLDIHMASTSVLMRTYKHSTLMHHIHWIAVVVIQALCDAARGGVLCAVRRRLCCPWRMPGRSVVVEVWIDTFITGWEKVISAGKASAARRRPSLCRALGLAALEGEHCATIDQCINDRDVLG